MPSKVSRKEYNSSIVEELTKEIFTLFVGIFIFPCFGSSGLAQKYFGVNASMTLTEKKGRDRVRMPALFSGEAVEGIVWG
jgi:hypothetical protein